MGGLCQGGLGNGLTPVARLGVYSEGGQSIQEQVVVPVFISKVKPATCPSGSQD